MTTARSIAATFSGRFVKTSHDSDEVVRINSRRSRRHDTNSGRSSNTSASDEQKTRCRSPAAAAALFHASGFFQFATEVRMRGAFGPQRSFFTPSVGSFPPPTRLSYDSA